MAAVTALLRRLAQVGLLLLHLILLPYHPPHHFGQQDPALMFVDNLPSLLKTSFSFGLQFLLTQVLAENSTSTFKVLLRTSRIFLESQGLDASKNFRNSMPESHESEVK